MRIPKPKRQTLRTQGDWFYSICSCGKLLQIDHTMTIPEHQYTIGPLWGIPEASYRCDRSLTPWTNPQ